jgi:hypothetical protein
MITTKITMQTIAKLINEATENWKQQFKNVPYNWEQTTERQINTGGRFVKDHIFDSRYSPSKEEKENFYNILLQIKHSLGNSLKHNPNFTFNRDSNDILNHLIEGTKEWIKRSSKMTKDEFYSKKNHSNSMFKKSSNENLLSERNRYWHEALKEDLSLRTVMINNFDKIEHICLEQGLSSNQISFVLSLYADLVFKDISDNNVDLRYYNDNLSEIEEICYTKYNFNVNLYNDLYIKG